MSQASPDDKPVSTDGYNESEANKLKHWNQ